MLHARRSGVERKRNKRESRRGGSEDRRVWPTDCPVPIGLGLAYVASAKDDDASLI